MNSILLTATGGVLGLGVWFIFSAVTGRQLLPRFTAASLRAAPLRRLSLAVVAAMVVLVATGWLPVAGLVLIGIMLFEGRLGGRSDIRNLTVRSDAIAAWTEMIYSTIAAGGGIEKAVIGSARSAPNAIREEVRRLAAQLEVRSLPEAMRAFAAEVAHPAADKVAVALVLAAEHGSHDLVALLRAQVESTRLEARMILEIEAGRARYRTSARIVVAVTVLMAAGLYVADRGYLEPYDTATGQMVLLCVGAVFLLGFWLLIRIADSPEPDRYFAGVTDRKVSET